jgi:ABC-2 type transport system ATP-binding protein
MKHSIGGDVITLTSRDPAALSATLRQNLGVETTVVDFALRLERPEGHKFIPQLIEAAAGLVDSVSVGKPTLEDVFIRVTGKSFAE